MNSLEILIQNILNWISVQNNFIIWIFFFISNLTENIFPPWPGDTVTVFGGFLMADLSLKNKNFGWLGLISSTYLGSLAGALIMYSFGERIISWIKNNDFPFKKSVYQEEELKKTFDWYQKNSKLVIVLSRFSAGIRFFVAIVAGITKVSPIQFILYFSIATILWNLILIPGGYYLGQNWQYLLQLLAIYNKVILSLIALIVFVFFYRKYKKKKENSIF